MSSWSDILPRDIRGFITSYLDQYDEYYPVKNHKKYITKYTASKHDMNKELRKYKSLEIFKETSV